ncbi:MAG: GNAT family N-acetyltransferase, partial [Silvanigrellaceae bacterium]|nr:GNAT family N-acetyltransferase [Silvanigrellaceae bacterium]
FESLPEEKELPEGCTVQLCDKNLLQQSPWFACLSLAAGGSNNFLENCFGYALVDEQGNWLAQAYGAFIGGDECEIGIITHPDHRGKGYIFYPLYAVMQECLNQDLVPVWSCNTENIASLKTALKFGFKINRHYAFLKRFKKIDR